MNRPTILIVEDSLMNQKLLGVILNDEYDTFVADNGEIALQMLNDKKNKFDCVILDLIMPVMGGFAFLREIKDKPAFQDLPIIVSTGSNGKDQEKLALELGAWDYVEKPYDNQILKFRIKNVIQRSQLSAFKRLKYLAEYDTLTDIYNGNKFREKAKENLDRHSEEIFAFVRFDIDRFKLINGLYGRSEGDNLLKHIASILKERLFAEPQVVYGKLEGDVFAFCIPFTNEDRLTELLRDIEKEIKEYNKAFDISPTFRVYISKDHEVPVDVMLDRASLASREYKGNYLNPIAFYKSEMEEQLEQEQAIINEMYTALEDNQFAVFIQPKYNLNSNRPSGGEALIRWNHPVKGMLSPDKFIPIFEKNVFITKLDYFVWEQVCKLLHTWIDKGINPAPISVNVSRANLYNPDIVQVIDDLVKKYEIPHNLFQIEITESAYIDNPQMVIVFSQKLRYLGYTVLMDDFGSGYSSLSILKTMPIDVLKIDIRFFEETEKNARGANIVANVVRMARWLDLVVIAEGVETATQVDFLHSLGCDYVQGYYFAKPMNVEEYEVLSAQKKAVEIKRETTNIELDRLWGVGPEMQLFFSNALQPIALYEYGGDSIEIVRINNEYISIFGTVIEQIKESLMETIMPDDRGVLLESFKQCAEEKGSKECIYQRKDIDGKVRCIQIKMHYICQLGAKKIILGYITDRTEQKRLEDELRRVLDVALPKDEKILSLKGLPKSESNDEGANFGQVIESMHVKAYVDALTDVYNRRYFNEMLFAYHGQNEPVKRLSLIMLDMSNFKHINDTYGHSVGDEVLRQVGKRLKQGTSSSDAVIRYGGDEFVVILVNSSEDHTRHVIEKLRKSIRCISYGPKSEKRANADFGYSYTEDFDFQTESLSELFRAADFAMYSEKRSRIEAEGGTKYDDR
ncbi:MAG: EAL domain-containing protein [Clostridiales bacterium]|nr:EAL domain-containing protein [Clostridiales bacterium]